MFELRDLRGIVAPSLVALGLVACGGGGGDAEGGAEAEGGAAPAAEIPFPVDAATAGNIRGTVTFSGTAPANEAIDMAEEPACASEHTTPPTKETVVTGANGALANVFVCSGVRVICVIDGPPLVVHPITSRSADEGVANLSPASSPAARERRPARCH